MTREPGTAGETSAETPLLTAARMVAWRRGGAGATAPRLGEGTLTHQASLLPQRGLLSRLRRLPGYGPFEVRLAGSKGREVALVACRGVGGPAAAVAIEELAVLGLRRLVALDIAGSIDPALRSGDTVVVQGALTEDGTSKHYTSAAVARPSPSLTATVEAALAAANVPFKRGFVWSTDAIYAETPSLIEAQRGRGATLVDLETAAVLAVAAALRLDAAAVVVVADELFDGEWRPPVLTSVQGRLRSLLPTLTAALRE